MSLFLILGSSAFGQGSSGERGATGVVIPDPDVEAKIKKDRKRLRDIADHTVCTYRYTEPALKILKLRSRVDDILKSLQSIHPYMSYRINQRMAGVNWCLTEHLHQVSTDDVDSVTISYLPQSQIAAIDLDAKITQVYIDKKNIKEYPVDDQAMTIIHEVLHTFLDRRLKRRNEKIRGITKAIYTNYIDSKKANYNRTYATQSLNASIDGYEAVSSFESVAFGQSFYRFLKFSKERDARLMVKYAKNIDQAFEVMVNELKHAELLSTIIFYKEFFWFPAGATSYLQAKYKLFIQPLQMLYDGATHFDADGRHGFYKLPFQTNELGTCSYTVEAENYDPVQRERPYEFIYENGEIHPVVSGKMVGSASIVVTSNIKTSRESVFKYGYPSFDIEYGQGMQTYYRISKDYLPKVLELLSKIKRGFCSDPHAFNLKYFY